MLRSNLVRHGATLLVVALVFLIRRPVESWVGVGASPIFYLPVVTLVAWYGGFGAGVAAVVTWGLLWLWFDIPPFGAMSVPTPTEQFRLVVFLSEGLSVATVVAMLHAARRSSVENARIAERYRLVSGWNEAQLRAILANSPAPIWLKDRDGRYLLVNQRFEELAQRRSLDVVGRTDSELFLPRIAEPLHFHDRLVLDQKLAVEVEEVLPLDGEPHIFLSVKFPILNAQGEASALGGIYTDITERKRAEAALRRERDFAEGLIDTAQVIVLILDRTGRVVRINPFLAQVAGYPPEQVQGEDWFARFVPLRDQYRAREAFQKAISRADGSRISHAIRTVYGGEREVEWAHRLLDGKGHDDGDDPESGQVLAIGHDITALKEAQTRAVRAERLAAIGQMMTGLAHESRNALQRSQACLEMLGFRLENRPEALDLLAGVQDALDDLQRLYEEVRCYAAPIHLDRQTWPICDLVRNAWDQLEILRKGRETDLVERGDMSILAQVDRSRLIQVLRNVLDNALAATDDPVIIEVEWSERQISEQPGIELSIRDNGPGLGADQRRNLFEPFYTTKTQGTGLGMAIARRIIEAHEGMITLGESAGSGAEIVITLPRSRGC